MMEFNVFDSIKIGLASPDPVSYTHLDGGRRQSTDQPRYRRFGHPSESLRGAFFRFLLSAFLHRDCFILSGYARRTSLGKLRGSNQRRFQPPIRVFQI